jgi:shikimate kinase
VVKNIVLIGFMGAGKTSIGRRLAQRLGRDFIDTDAEIEAVTGKTISQIFARHGVIRFRSEEKLLVKRLAGREGLVISTGGGMALDPENVRLLKEKGVLITLTASPEVLCGRLANKKTRPLVLKGDLRQRIEKLLEERKGIYDVADFFVDTGVCSLDGAVEQILLYLSGREDMK